MTLEQSARPEIAMVSRIRVEVRGESLKAAEEVAFQLLDHARLAGVLEGFVPTSGAYADPHFSRPGLTARFGEVPEAWNELGLPYYGRLSFVFDPMSGYGGLRQHGYTVIRARSDGPYVPGETPHGFIVLNRQRPVQREHVWEVSALRDSPGETGESILADIRTIKDARLVKANLEEDGGWVVSVEMDGWENVLQTGDNLKEAAAKARREIVEMLEQAVDVSPADIEAPFVANMHIANLNIPTFVEATGHREYRTLIVGTETAREMASAVTTRARTGQGYEVCVVLDLSHDKDQWTLTTEEPHEAAARIRLGHERIAGV